MIAFLTLELRIEHAQSLKDKRQVVRSLKDRLRAHFNVAVAELDSNGLWNRATLGVVSVSDSRDYLDGLMKNVERHALRIANNGGAEVAYSFVLVRGTVVERRGQKYHRERLGEALREEIETIVEGELGDPRIGLVSVSQVALAEDARSAQVFVAVEGDEDETLRTMQGLMAAVGFIRREVGERLQLRHPPELFFHLDRSEQYGARIDELLKRTRKVK